MTSKQVTANLQVWSSRSTEAPLNSSTQEATTPAGTGSLGATDMSRSVTPGQDKVSMSSSQAPTPGLHLPETFDTPSAAPDGTWLTALLIGTILTTMIVVIAIIFLWKCCKKPLLTDTNWAGRSPFADGDVPEVFAELEQPNKRSSILSMLPWKLRQEASAAGGAASPPERGPEGRGPRAGETGAASAAEEAGAAAGASAAGAAAGASPALEPHTLPPAAAKCPELPAPAECPELLPPAAAECPELPAPPAEAECAELPPPAECLELPLPPAEAECPELPAPPAWLQEAAAGSGPGLGGHPLWEAQVPLPPAPRLGAQETLPELPLRTSPTTSAKLHVS